MSKTTKTTTSELANLTVRHPLGINKMSKQETKEESELNVVVPAVAASATPVKTTASDEAASSATNNDEQMIFTSTFNPSVGVSPSSFCVHYITHSAMQYVRTRHNNMRCFPQCSKPHKSTSFCGRFVEVLVQSTLISAEDAKRALFFGEFRKTNDDPAFVIGNEVERSMLKEQADKFMVGEFVNDHSTGYHYMFDPKKRWTCLGRIQSGEEFVMTAYLAVNGMVTCCVDSSPFQIIPVWKTEDRKRVRTSSHAKHAAASVAAATAYRGSEDDGDASSEEEDLAQAATRAVFSHMSSSTTTKQQPHRDMTMLQHHRSFPPFSPTQDYAAMRRFSPTPTTTTTTTTTLASTGTGTSAAQFSVFQPLQFSQMTPVPSPYSTTPPSPYSTTPPPPTLGSGLFVPVQQQQQQQFQPPTRLQTQTPSPPMTQHMYHHLPTQSSSASSSLPQFQPLLPPPPSSPSRIQFSQPFLSHSPSNNTSLFRQQQYTIQQQQQFGGMIMQPPPQQQQMFPRTLDDLLASSSSAKETGLLQSLSPPPPPQTFTSFTLPNMQQQQQQPPPPFPPPSSQYRQ